MAFEAQLGLSESQPLPERQDDRVNCEPQRGWPLVASLGTLSSAGWRKSEQDLGEGVGPEEDVKGQSPPGLFLCSPLLPFSHTCLLSQTQQVPSHLRTFAPAVPSLPWDSCMALPQPFSGLYSNVTTARWPPSKFLLSLGYCPLSLLYYFSRAITTTWVSQLWLM